MNFNNKGHKVQSLNQGISLIMRHRTIINEASLALTYWQQRIKERHLQLGDIPSKFLFNRLRQKKQQNYVFMLRNSSGDWVDNPPKIAQMLQSYFKDIFMAADGDPFLKCTTWGRDRPSAKRTPPSSDFGDGVTNALGSHY